MDEKITLSVIKADIGSFVGHCVVHPALIEVAKKNLESAKARRLIIDYYITNCGDDLNLILTHRQGENSTKVHELTWNVFQEGTKVATELHLYGAGQDLLLAS